MSAFLGLVLRNALRRKLRTALTVLGLVISVMAFGLLQTVVTAWYAGAEGASSARLITRNAISLVFPLPISYRERLRAVEGVKSIGIANWFGGIYREPRNFFPQFAIDETYLRQYAEYLIPADDLKAWQRDRRGAIVGRKLADTWGFRVGDTVILRGTIYPGDWQFVVRAVYDGRDAGVDTSQFFFHWSYLNERIARSLPRRADQVGVFVVELHDPDDAAEVSRAIDTLFRNSPAETLTETERAFQLSFVAMTEALVVAIRTVSFLVIAIILAVMANTMAMTARERLPEYATLKALGFGPGFVAALVFGESLFIAALGGGLGIALTFPVAAAFASAMGSFFPVFEIGPDTLLLQAGSVLVVGLAAAAAPALRAARVGIVDGLRAIG